MLDIGIPEMLVILVVVLLVFGPGKLPEVGRGVGRMMGEFRRFTSGAGILEAIEQRPTTTTSAPPVGVTMRCVTCGAANPPANRYCGNCGREVSGEAPTSRPV